MKDRSHAGPSRRIRFTIAILVLCMIPIAVAVVVGVVRKADSGDARRADPTAEVEDPVAGGDRGDALVVLGVVGVLVAGCVVTPFVLAARDRRRSAKRST